MYYILTESSVDEYLSCFHVLAIIDHAAINTEVHVSFQAGIFVFSDIYPGVELLGHIVVLFSVF